MKITHIEVFDIHCPKRPAWNPVFVRIHTDEGISGVGEAACAYSSGSISLLISLSQSNCNWLA